MNASASEPDFGCKILVKCHLNYDILDHSINELTCWKKL